MDQLIHLSRLQKRLISVAIDALFVMAAFWLAYFLRLSSLVDFSNLQHWQALGVLVVATLFVNSRLGLYRAVIRFLSLQALLAIAKAVALSAAALVMISLLVDSFLPRSIPIIFASFLFVFIAGSRLTVRNLANKALKQNKTNVLIYGAGDSGRQLFEALQSGSTYNPVAFIDDDNNIQNLTISGLSVYKKDKLTALIQCHDIQQILLALPQISRLEKAQIIEELKGHHVEVLAMPCMADIVSGKAKIDDLKEVSIDDLLGRDQVPPNDDLLKANINNQVVMVTGAGGSIGSELSRQILKQGVRKLILLDASEYNLYAIEQELQQEKYRHQLDAEIVPVLANIQDKDNLNKIFGRYCIDTLYHAAAYKHVPLVESNKVEGIKNNVFGTLNVATVAVEQNISTFVLVSTDKAVRPTNIMGASKRVAELILQGLAQEEHNTRFCMVRFGNVLGSSGSVVPLFKEQIKQGGPLTVTHKDINRYFMTIPEAAQLVIQAGAMGKGGDVFLLDMGEPVKIYELAKNMIQLSGLQVKDNTNPNGDIEIVFTGLRPGEKLYEELLIDDNAWQTGHPRIMAANESFFAWPQLSERLQQLQHFNHAGEIDQAANLVKVLAK